MKDRFLPTLDGWRAVAILMVVCSHWITLHSGNPNGAVYRLAFRAGTLGVMIFFAVSGYLICTRLLIEEESTGAISLRKFYVRRIFRILPAAYAYLAVTAGLAAGGWIFLRWQDIAAPAFFYANYKTPESWSTGHFWSLSLEEHFYILWPPMLVLLGRTRARWACILMICLTSTMRLWSGSPRIEAGQTHLQLDAFLFPCLLAILLRDAEFGGQFRQMMRPWVWWRLTIVTAFGVGLVYVLPAWREPQRLLQSAVFPVLIAATVLRPNDWMGRILRLPLLEWIGRISYSIYLWQQIIVAGGLEIPLFFQPPLILLLAVTSERFIERPFIALGRALGQRLSLMSESG